MFQNIGWADVAIFRQKFEHGTQGVLGDVVPKDLNHTCVRISGRVAMVPAFDGRIVLRGDPYIDFGDEPRQVSDVTRIGQVVQIRLFAEKVYSARPHQVNITSR